MQACHPETRTRRPRHPRRCLRKPVAYFRLGTLGSLTPPQPLRQQPVEPVPVHSPHDHRVGRVARHAPLVGDGHAGGVLALRPDLDGDVAGVEEGGLEEAGDHERVVPGALPDRDRSRTGQHLQRDPAVAVTAGGQPARSSANQTLSHHSSRHSRVRSARWVSWKPNRVSRAIEGALRGSVSAVICAASCAANRCGIRAVNASPASPLPQWSGCRM
jgi:hypothetical protein